METILRTQEEFDQKATVLVGLTNILYNEDMQVIPIDWRKEYIKIVTTVDVGHTSNIVTRIKL